MGSVQIHLILRHAEIYPEKVCPLVLFLDPSMDPIDPSVCILPEVTAVALIVFKREHNYIRDAAQFNLSIKSIDLCLDVCTSMLPEFTLVCIKYTHNLL